MRATSQHVTLEQAFPQRDGKGMVEAGIGLATRRLFVRQDRCFAGDDRVNYEISWV